MANPTTVFICPLCGAQRKSRAVRQWCKRGHQVAAMRAASVARASDTAMARVPGWSDFCEAMGTRCTHTSARGVRCDNGVTNGNRCAMHQEK